MDNLTLDDRFHLLLHKKLMNKQGAALRRAKKYYKDQYRKTGIIPGPLLLAEKGIMEGRRCSGRPRSLDDEARKHFIAMVKASCDPSNPAFIFITRKARTIKNYHHWLQVELNRPVSISALRRSVKRDNLKPYLTRPDFDDDVPTSHCFDPVPVFDLIQMDGCKFHYLKIRDDNGYWQQPQVIELFDTGSRYMFVLDVYFSESSLNAVELFTQFLLSTPFPQKTFRIRPDNAKGFLNLKRAFNAVNLAHSVPKGFYMDADFARIHAPKDKAHLESSHRSLHHFEIRIIKAFEDRIVKTVPGYVFTRGKREQITVTLLDISRHELRTSSLIQGYCHEHNATKHYFSENGKISTWVPEQKLAHFFQTEKNTLTFAPQQVRQYIKYGLRKTPATVSTKKTIRCDNRIYHVTVGADAFSNHKSTPVKISRYHDKLFIFEPTDNGILLGEAMPMIPPEHPVKSPVIDIEKGELEQIISFLEHHDMTVDRPVLIETYNKGLSLEKAKNIFNHNHNRYMAYQKKMKQPDHVIGMAVFNAFILDCQAHHRKMPVAPYAIHGDI
jgi:hypothetical protein